MTEGGTRRATEHVDVLIVGSGPAGSAYARAISDIRPDVTILMVEVGPKLSDAIGEHTSNMTEVERLASQRASQGPDAGVARPQLDISQVSREPAGDGGLPFIWPGLFTVGERAQLEGEDGLPVASMSSGIGGMGVYWSGSCPRPNDSERIAFIPDDEFEALYARAEQLLSVRKNLQDGDELLAALRDAVAAEFDADAPRAAPVGFMPVASSRAGGRMHTSGTAEILGPLAAGSPTFEIRPDTLARRVLFDDGAAVGAELLDRISGAAYELRARRVVVCGDALRTPQLLFASGVRPRALGHHLNDHFQMTAMIKLHDEFVRAMPAPGKHTATGSVLIPFSPGRPMQGQVVALSRTGYVMPIGTGSRAEGLGRLGMLAWYGAKDIQYRDAVEFSNTERDYYGMPAMTIRYTLTDVDRQTLASMRANIDRCGKVVGDLLTEPNHAPGGSSLHYQGTVRMGLADDGESVCDPYARVWGVEHLFVGGNGLIPTSTAANPTLTNVARSRCEQEISSHPSCEVSNRGKPMIRPIAVLLAVALAAATVVTTAGVASAAPPGANMEGTGAQPKGQGLGSKAALAQDSCDSATGRTNFEVVGGGPWCVNPWPEGKDNGGVTATGVTADTVKVIVYVPNEQMIAKQGSTSPPKNRATGEKASYEDVIRDYVKVYEYAQANLQTFQTWGRTPKFEFVTASGDDEASQRADAVGVLAKKPFIVVDEGNVTTGSPVFAAAVAAGKTIVVSQSTNAESGTKQSPYRWGIQDPDASSYLVASFLGRSLNGEAAQWAGDKELQSKPRAFGVVHPATEFDVDAFKQRMKDSLVSASQYIDYDNSDSAKAQEQAPTIISKFKSSGVTTVVLFADAPMMSSLMKAATSQQYSPEWIITGFAFHDWDGFGRGADQSQMAHAFGTGVLPPLYEGSGLNNYFNWYWGPNQGNSAEGLAYSAQPVYEMLHYAGPTLTAANVEKGRFSAPAIGGASDGTTYFQTGFGKTVKLPYDEHDALGTDRDLAWWNPDITGGTNAVGTLVGKGKFMYLDGGKRYAYGEFPTKEPKFFDSSVSSAEIPLSSRYANGVVPATSPCTGCPSNGGTGAA